MRDYLWSFPGTVCIQVVKDFSSYCQVHSRKGQRHYSRMSYFPEHNMAWQKMQGFPQAVSAGYIKPD